LGQAPNLLIYSRNLYLVKKEKNLKKELTWY
jgi:lipid-A-disaccharide synthase-like uncharacterized protein